MQYHDAKLCGNFITATLVWLAAVAACWFTVGMGPAFITIAVCPPVVVGIVVIGVLAVQCLEALSDGIANALH